MSSCKCGCGANTKFGRKFFSQRAVELKTASDLASLIAQSFVSKPLPRVSQTDAETSSNDLLESARRVSQHSSCLHDFAIAIRSKEGLPSRSDVWNDERGLLHQTGYMAVYCQLYGAISSEQLLKEQSRLSAAQLSKFAQGYSIPFGD